MCGGGQALSQKIPEAVARGDLPGQSLYELQAADSGQGQAGVGIVEDSGFEAVLEPAGDEINGLGIEPAGIDNPGGMEGHIVPFPVV